MKKFKSSMLATVGVLALSVWSVPAFSDYPERPIKVIVPYGAGGDSDLTTRIWADAMEKELDVPVVVINKPGGGGVVGTTSVANSKADGYTLINAGLGNMLVTPNFSKIPYDFSSFTPIVKMTAVPLAIVVPADSPYKTFDEFVAAAKAERLTQGSWGAASSGTVLANIIAEKMGYNLKYVHANTTAKSVASVAGGHIDSAVSFPPAFGPHVQADRVRVLIINQKMDDYPNVPTFSDYEIEGSFEGWSGIFAPEGVPQNVVDTLVSATEKVMKKPKVIQSYQNMGALVDFRHGDEWINDMKVTYGVMEDSANKNDINK